MRAGRFVGRVGGLAVALGVGVAVASNPWVAWAEDGSSPGADSTPPSSTAPQGTDGASTTTETATETASPSTGTDSGASTTKTGSEDVSTSDTSASSGASVRTVPSGTAMSTGGADSSTNKSTTKPSQKRGSKKQQRHEDPTDAHAVDATTLSATEVTSQPKVSAPPRIAAQEPVTAPDAGTASAPHATFVATQAISASPDESIEPSATVTAVALTASAGVDPLAPSGPMTPVDSPLELALLAVGARSRNETIDGEQTFAVATTMAAVNSAPVVPAQPVGIPNPVTGVVTGTVIATDPDNNPLTYTVASGPSAGTIVLNAQTGAYTYTPTPAARIAAGVTTTADIDAFIVAVGDGQQTTSAPVSVYISPLRFENQASIAVGTSPSAAVVGPDGRMWVANTGSNTVSVINTATGQRIDANSSYFSKDISVGSSPSALALSADGKRLYVANTGSGSISVIDTATYKRIDVNPSWSSKDIKVGSSPSALMFGSDGRLYVANRGSNTVSVIDTSTNKLIDANPNISGVQSISVGSTPCALALDGNRLYVANRGNNTVSVIDISSYSVTNTISVGSQPSSMALVPGGRLYVANTGGGTVSVINTATNTVGTSAISVGPSPSSVALNSNGSLAYVANANDTVSVIDTATNKVVNIVAIDTDTTGGHVVAVSPSGTVYVTDAADKTVRVLTLTRGNTAPIAGTPTIGTPTGTGAVSIALSATDPDGDTLSYSLIQPAAGGSVLITGIDTYVFTPTQAARLAAATGGPTSTTFMVNASDGQTATPISVTVPIAAVDFGPGATVIGNITVNGWTTGKPQLMTADGTRALITTYASGSLYNNTTTLASVINTTSGTLIGTIPVTGWLSYSLFSANGSRALIVASPDGANSTKVAVINPTTGTQVGTILTLTGKPAGALLSADGSRALIATSNYDPLNNTTNVTTWVTVINTTTGTTTGTTFTLPGQPVVDVTLESLGAFQALNADDTRALITTRVYNATSRTYSTRVAVLNTTGTQTGSTVTLNLDEYGLPHLSPDGTRALISDSTFGTPYTSRVAVIDTTTGRQVGSTLTLTGDLQLTRPQWTPNGTRAIFTANVTDAGGAANTQVSVIDTINGTQLGATFTLPGAGRAEVSADGTRVLFTAYVADATNVTTRMALIDSTTGTQIGTTVTRTVPVIVAGSGGTSSTAVPLDAHASRALVTTSVYNPAIVDLVTRLAVIDTKTGTQLGSDVTLIGEPKGSLLLSANRVLATTYSYSVEAGKYTTRVAVIDSTTGSQVGTTLTLSGYQFLPPRLSADGTRAVMSISDYDPATASYRKWVIEIHPATGAQIGTAVPFTDPGYQLLSADGTRAVTVTSAFPGDGTTQVTVLRIA